MKDLISTETYGAQKIKIKCNKQLIRKNATGQFYGKISTEFKK